MSFGAEVLCPEICYWGALESHDEEIEDGVGDDHTGDDPNR